MPNAEGQKKGRGWFGDSEGHRRAGRKGGRARHQNSSQTNTSLGEE